MGKNFGIDLGTTNSCLSVHVKGNTSQVVKLDNDKTTMPSCVMWLGGDNWIVGSEAYEHRYQENVCYSIKSHMGTNYKHTFKYNGETCEKTPEEISAIILKAICKKASYLYPDIKDVTITVPAEFSNDARVATKKAGELAGLNVVSIINEPTSAALGYNVEDDQTVVVYDLGGGTFDVSILKIENLNIASTNDGAQGLNFSLLGVDLNQNETTNEASKSYEVLVSEGDRHLGGDDIDTEWYNIIIRKYNEKHKFDNLKGIQNRISQEEKEKIILRLEKYKIFIQDNLSSKITITTSAGEELDTTAEDLISATRKIYNKTKLSVNRALGNLKVDRTKVSEMLLVGGSTKSKILQSLIENDFPDWKISKELNPDEAVAYGASIQTAVTKGEASTAIMDVSPYTISVEVLATNADGSKVSGRTAPIVKKNTLLPVSTKHSFSVSGNNKDLKVSLYLGESSLVKECEAIGDVIIERNNDDKLANLIVTVDTNGMLTLKIESGGITKEAQIINILGIQKKAGTKKVTPYSRLANRWRNQLEASGMKWTKKLETALTKFSENGDNKSKEYISLQLSKMKNVSEVTREKTNIFGTDSEEENQAGEN